jgi:hypothetical protein
MRLNIKIVSIYVCLICFGFLTTHCQTANESYTDVLHKVKEAKTFNQIYTSLDSLEKLYIPSRSGIDLYLDRSFDCGFTHKRILVRLNFFSFQLDFLTKRDSIFFLSLKSLEDNKKYFEFDKIEIDNLLVGRNKLYNSTKSIKNLESELTISESFAMYCGDGLPLTKKGKEILDLVDNENINEFREMTKSFSPEIQAYGVTGLEMIEKRNGELLPYDKWVINYLKKRNSEVITCSGCLDGIITKLYSKDKRNN